MKGRMSKSWGLIKQEELHQGGSCDAVLWEVRGGRRGRQRKERRGREDGGAG